MEKNCNLGKTTKIQVIIVLIVLAICILSLIWTCSGDGVSNGAEAYSIYYSLHNNTLRSGSQVGIPTGITVVTPMETDFDENKIVNIDAISNTKEGNSNNLRRYQDSILEKLLLATEGVLIAFDNGSLNHSR